MARWAGAADLGGAVRDLAWAPGSDRAVAVAGDRLWAIRADPAGLSVGPDHPLPECDLAGRPEVRSARAEVRVAFLDDRTALVAQVVERGGPPGSIPPEERSRTQLAAVDLDTGAEVGRFDIAGGILLTVAPVAIGPRRALLSLAGKTLLDIDLDAGRELGRIREVDAQFDPVGPDADVPEERIAPDGVVFDPDQGLLHVLWRYFNAGVAQTYAWGGNGAGFASVRRGRAIEGQGWGHDANGLALAPDSRTRAAWFPIFDRKVGPAVPGTEIPPETAVLGQLAVFRGDDPPRMINVESRLDRDFLVSADVAILPGGRVFGGFRLSTDEVPAFPFFRDDRRVVIHTPGGRLLEIDTGGGRVDLLHDLGAPAAALAFHRGSGRLLVAGGGRSLRGFEL